ncbi:Transcriptional regulator, DeoR family protein [Enhygromyxa salina]|uniref:Transcriptional regulator, DeoR family protein n=1 Tax=Enhygromyxa salina TaxID=215803 RepID=A0A0C1ZX78_9BACT|nr:YafY family protein [Enhygromyxa salina]KIG15673.1 Transcriptional regulator, DeoR family protein [Enhygromyxa salina]
MSSSKLPPRMRRADRLFQIVSILRSRRLTTAAQLAQRLEVSERTIYRDIADLGRSGVPILGEAGVGYRVGKDFDLPPLMFNRDEIQALVLGARMVETWGDDELKQAARAALDKVEAVLPSRSRGQMKDTALFALSFSVPPTARETMGIARKAVDEQRKLSFTYSDRERKGTRRTVRPLGLYFWGATWTLGAWCELREDFRNFRLDRIAAPQIDAETFELAPPVTLADYVLAMTADER